MMKNLGRVMVFVVILGCLGCAAGQVLPTASGRPEIVINNASETKIKQVLINSMISSGWNLKSSASNILVFGKEIHSTGAAILFGTSAAIYPEARVTFTIVEAPGGVRVIASNQMVQNPGTGHERFTEVNSGQIAQNTQRSLEKLKEAF
jgi:hypothetical protein